MANSASERTAHALWMQEEMDRLEGEWAPRVLDLMDEQAERAAAAIADGGDWERHIEEEGMAAVLRPLYEDTFMAFARRGYAEWMREVLRILGAEAATRIKGMMRTSKQYVRSILLAAMEEGVGVEEAARRVRDRMPELNRWRSKRIARTELNSAANAGTHTGIGSAADALGVEMEKVWWSILESDTRESHGLPPKGAHGQRRAMDEPFNVGGVLMQHPMEFGAPADEVVNCKCTTLYEVKA